MPSSLLLRTLRSLVQVPPYQKTPSNNKGGNTEGNRNSKNNGMQRKIPLQIEFLKSNTSSTHNTSKCTKYEKEIKIQPDVVENGKNTGGKPMFDLILGIQTMDEIRIIPDFKTR
jgi:hypothetical protein